MKTNETRHSGSLGEYELREVLKKAVMFEAGVQTWTSGVHFTIDARQVFSSGELRIGFTLVVDHDHHLKALALPE